MNDGEALLAAILENPTEIDRRLIYADWLEETGDPENLDRARFIRHQIHFAEPFGENTPEQALAYWEEDRWIVRAVDHAEWEWLFPGPLQQFFDSGRWTWSGCGSDLRITAWETPEAGDYEWRWRNGFVDEVKCSLKQWAEFGPALVRLQPIQRIELTNVTVFREPDDRWMCGVLDTELRRSGLQGRLIYYSLPVSAASQGAMLTAISERCLAWARATASSPVPSAG